MRLWKNLWIMLFLKLCRQTVRNNLKEQDPESVLKYNEEVIKKMKEMGAFRKHVIVAMDWHDIMFYS
jgi:hypothetical protein